MCSGYADDFQLPGRMAHQGVAKLAVDNAAVFNDTLRDVEDRKQAVANDDRCATSCGRHCIVVAICVWTGDGDEHVAGADLAPIGCATADANIRQPSAMDIAEAEFTERNAPGDCG